MIADSIKEELDEGVKYEYDRHSKREKRTNNEIGIHSVRGGTITGEHQVIFAGHDEIITISHRARSFLQRVRLTPLNSFAESPQAFTACRICLNKNWEDFEK